MSTSPQAPAQVSDETIVLRDDFVPDGRTVPTGNGWLWIVQGWNLFTRAPGLWIGMMVVLILVQGVLGLIPLVGIVVSLLLPVFMAGLVIASRSLDQGGNARFGQLFAGFKHRFGSLLLVGVISLALAIVITLIGLLAAGAGDLFWNRAAVGPEVFATKMLLGVLVVLALMLPLVMATWFAAALIAFHEMSAVEAMKSSFVACLKNFLPFLVYGLILLIPSFIATLPLGLGWLVLGPVVAASIYTAYRDIYFERSAV
jgi:uncharacterized membrane protein